MNAKTVMAVGLLCFLMVVCMATFVPTTYAAKAAASDPPETGLGSVFKSRKATGVGPTSTQLGLTIGATIVMIAVVRYL